MAAAAKTTTTDISVPVSFVCQHCLSPLNLDRSFSLLDENVVSELSGGPGVLINSENDDDDSVTLIGAGDRRQLVDDACDIGGGGGGGGGGSGVVHFRNVGGTGTSSTTTGQSTDCVFLADIVNRKVTPPIRLTESGNGFTLVGESPGHDDTGCLSHMLKVSSRLFDIVSDQSDVDHPLCEECTDALLDQMDHILQVTENEYRDYQEFLEKLDEQDEAVEEVSVLENDLRQLRLEEERLLDELKEVEENKKRAIEELALQDEEMERLRVEEERYLREYFNYKRQLLMHNDDQCSIENQLHYAQAQLDKLKKTNVFNASFHIWHSGHFGTINNFRLGRLPNVPVEWSEINAAWGQTVLLLHSLAKKIDLNFQRYRLVPYGNHSYLECLADKAKELPLYGSGGIRFFWDTKFDQAMVAFLDCLQQFKEEVEKGDTGFCLPYKMDKGHIEDTGMGNSYSVKTQFNSEEQWTKALKFMLTNLKWGLAWVSSQFVNK